MAFIITGIYVLALFSAGVYFVRQGKREKDDQEEHCRRASVTWNGADRRSGQDRRTGSDRRHSTDPVLSR
jgi:hypothetical protein